MKLITNSPGATRQLGENIGRLLRGGEAIELIGDLGAGKTTFTKGLACGLDSSDHVSSPTFVIENVYHGRHTLRHLDLYRLNESGLMTHQLEDAFADQKAVIVIEWGKVVKDALPENRIKIDFKPTDDESRELNIHIPKDRDYLKQAVR